MIIKKNRAFLLIEALVTVAVVTASILFINQAFTTSLRAAAISNDYIKAVLFAEDKAYDFEIEPLGEEGELSASDEFMRTVFKYTETISALSEEELGEDYAEKDLGLKKLKLNIAWSRQNAERSMDIETYLYEANDDIEE